MYIQKSLLCEYSSEGPKLGKALSEELNEREKAKAKGEGPQGKTPMCRKMGNLKNSQRNGDIQLFIQTCMLLGWRIYEEPQNEGYPPKRNLPMAP